MAGARPDGRAPTEMRPVEMVLGYQEYAEGSVLISMGHTRVLCAATVEECLPPWRPSRDEGWVTAEFSMLPRSTRERTARHVSARETEIAQLIGRALRTTVDLQLLGPRTVTVDCDVLLADGGTRCAAITGGCVALALAIQQLVREKRVPPTVLLPPVAAASVAQLDGELILDPCAEEDIRSNVDCVAVFNADGLVVEVEAPAVRPFPRDQLDRILDLAAAAAQELVRMQRDLLAS